MLSPMLSGRTRWLHNSIHRWGEMFWCRLLHDVGDAYVVIVTAADHTCADFDDVLARDFLGTGRGAFHLAFISDEFLIAGHRSSIARPHPPRVKGAAATVESRLQER